MIGLCGNMDGETVSELRDSQRCILSSGTLMAASYQLNDGQQGKQCSGLPDKIRGQLREEQNTCNNKHDWDPTAPTPIYSPPPSSRPDVCIARRTKVAMRNDDVKCFSTSAVKECRSTCHGVHFKPIIVNMTFCCSHSRLLNSDCLSQIGFHCVTDPKLGEELDQEAKHKVLTFMFGKNETFRTTLFLPTVCRPNAEQVDSAL